MPSAGQVSGLGRQGPGSVRARERVSWVVFCLRGMFGAQKRKAKPARLPARSLRMWFGPEVKRAWVGRLCCPGGVVLLQLGARNGHLEPKSPAGQCALPVPLPLGST